MQINRNRSYKTEIKLIAFIPGSSGTKRTFAN